MSIAGGLLTSSRALGAEPPARLPNVVIIFCDDMAYADVGCFGSKVPTPNIDSIAKRGIRFTDFYVSQAVCSASRASLLTGCYNVRVGIFGALGPGAKIGLNPDELNLAKLCKQRGYATGIFGKWHLGSLSQFMPLRQGFDQYAGVPYSHDMWPRHPETPKAYPDLPLYQGQRVIEKNPEPWSLTGIVTRYATQFIDDHKDQPFLLYVPHPLPHVPLGVSENFAGKSGRGTYGDVIAEIDWSVGQILGALRRHGIEDNTLVMFASDNGPWTTYGDHAGDAGPLREAKATSFEGGVRVPCVMQWPGKFPPGSVSREPLMTIDILPTIATALGVELPKDRVIDGKDLTPLLIAGGQRPADRPPIHDALYFYWGEHLQAVRSGKWKLHFPHEYRMAPEQRATGGKPNKARTGKIGLALFDLEADPGETTDLAKEHPDVVDRLKDLAQRMRADLGDSATKEQGTGRRAPGEAP
jgi:arylsulfatase A-like enzyme